VLLLAVPGSVAGFPLWGDASVGVTQYHHLTLFQGDDPDSAETAPREQVQVLDRTYWAVPWNSSEIFTYIPPQARNATVDNVKAISHQGGSIFMPGDFSAAVNPDDPPVTGWMEGSGNEGYYYWKFPEAVTRDIIHALTFATSADFKDADPELTDTEEWNVTDGTLSLASNVSSSTHVSKRYLGGVDLVSVNMSFVADHGQNMSFDVSSDNGTTWLPAFNGTPLGFPGTSNEFRWRVTMTQDTSENATPVLHEVAFQVQFTPEYNDIIIEARYSLDIVDKDLVFDQVYPFDSTSSTFVFIGYFDPDMDLNVNGTEVTSSVGSTYPTKVTYTHMTGGHDPIITFTVTDTTTDDGTDGEQTSYWIYIVVLLLVLVMVMGVAMVLMSDRRKKAETGQLGPTVEGDGEPVDDDDLEALTLRRAEMVEAIRDLDGDHEIGLIDDGEHEARREELKVEAVEVIKRIEDAK